MAAIMMASALKQEQIERMEDMMAFLDKQVKEITKYSEALVRRLVEKITVYDEKLMVEFILVMQKKFWNQGLMY